MKRIVRLARKAKRFVAKKFRLTYFFVAVVIPSFIYGRLGYVTFVGFRGMGDTCYELMFLDEYLKLHSSKIRVLCLKSKSAIFSYYPQITKVKYVGKHMHKLLINQDVYDKYNDRFLWLVITTHPRKPGSSMIERALNVFRLPIDGKYEITYPSVNAILDEQVPQKSIFINTRSNFYESNSIKEHLLMLGKYLCEERGYSIYYNDLIIFDFQSKWISTYSYSLANIYCLANKVEAVFSIRTGLLDFLVNADSNIWAFYDYSKTGLFLRNLFSLTTWNGKSTIVETHVEDFDLIKIDNWLKMLK